MIIMLNTSTAECQITLVSGTNRTVEKWQADRQLAHGLLTYLHDTLAKHDCTFDEIEGIGVYKGPGSFTGLRIGLTVLNTLADARHIPIVGETGDDWQNKALGRLHAGENDKVVLPLYGSEANITKPRK